MHDAEVRGVRECEVQVGRRVVPEAVDRIERARALVRLRGDAHLLGERVQPFVRHCGQQFLAIGEVPVARARRHADRAGRLAQREALDAALGDECQRGTDQAVAEVAVVVGRTGRDHHGRTYVDTVRTPLLG